MTPATSLFESQPASLLVLTPSESFTRADVQNRSDALYTRLCSGNIQRVLVHSEHPVDLLRAVDACNRAGSDLWIAHTTLSAASVEAIAEKFDIQLVIAQTDQLRTATSGKGAPPAGRIHLMTSGTTGIPKLVIHTLSSLLGRVAGSAGVPGNRDGRWLLTYQPTAFAGLQVLLTALLSNGALVVPDRRSPLEFYQVACQHDVTHISGTPTFWRSFLLLVQPGSLNPRQITLGGEAIDQPTLDRLRAAFPAARITHIYASTEAGVIFAVHDGLEGFPAEWLNGPVQGVQMRIQDGVLQVKTSRVMQGYATEVPGYKIEDGWLTTGDLVTITGARVHFLGRQDAMLNIGGAKVYPQTVEAFLLSREGVIEARVRGIPNPLSGFLLAAEIVLSEGMDTDATRARILAESRKELASYQVPRILKIVDRIEVTASGKKASGTAKTRYCHRGQPRSWGSHDQRLARRWLPHLHLQPLKDSSHGTSIESS